MESTQNYDDDYYYEDEDYYNSDLKINTKNGNNLTQIQAQ